MDCLNGKFEVLGSCTRPQENGSGGNHHIRDPSQETHPNSMYSPASYPSASITDNYSGYAQETN